MVSPSQIFAPFSTIKQGEVTDVTPGQGGMATPQVPALASARVGKALPAFQLQLLARQKHCERAWALIQPRPPTESWLRFYKSQIRKQKNPRKFLHKCL